MYICYMVMELFDWYRTNNLEWGQKPSPLFSPLPSSNSILFRTDILYLLPTPSQSTFSF